MTRSEQKRPEAVAGQVAGASGDPSVWVIAKATLGISLAIGSGLAREQLRELRHTRPLCSPHDPATCPMDTHVYLPMSLSPDPDPQPPLLPPLLLG